MMFQQNVVVNYLPCQSGKQKLFFFGTSESLISAKAEGNIAFFVVQRTPLCQLYIKCIYKAPCQKRTYLIIYVSVQVIIIVG